MSEDEEAFYNQAQTGSSSVSQNAPTDGPSPHLSKSAMKRAARQARVEALRPQKRALEKARRKERAQQLAQGYAAGTLTAEEKAIVENRKAMEKARKSSKRKAGEGKLDFWGGGVVVDLGFDKLMTDQEITSMTSQLGYLYSANRTAAKPFASILHTSFSSIASPRLWEKMSKSAWTRWINCSWWAEDVGELAKVMRDGKAIDSSTEESEKEVDDNDVPENHLSGPRLPPRLTKEHKLVYLSADAEEELSTLAEDEVYIIGGIVDRNRYKNLCQEKAQKLGIRTARLPIDTYIAHLPTRKVLTVNQVFSILVEYVTRQNWSEAFNAAIPPRKFEPGRKKRKGKDGSAIDEGDTKGQEGIEEDDHQEVDEKAELDPFANEIKLEEEELVNA